MINKKAKLLLTYLFCTPCILNIPNWVKIGDSNSFGSANALLTSCYTKRATEIFGDISRWRFSRGLTEEKLWFPMTTVCNLQRANKVSSYLKQRDSSTFHSFNFCYNPLENWSLLWKTPTAKKLSGDRKKHKVQLSFTCFK